MAMPLSLASCQTGAPNQTFALAVVPPFVNPAAVKSSLGFCLDIGGRSNEGSTVRAFACGSNPINSRADQYWQIGKTTIASLQVNTPYCFGFASASAQAALVDCSASTAQFDIGFGENRKTGGQLVHKQSGYCVTATGTPPPMPPTPKPRPPDPHNTPCTPTPAPAPSPPAPPVPADARPCDIYAGGGTPCVAAHSMVRALYSNFSGALYSIRRESDRQSHDIGVTAAGALADAKGQDQFCAGTSCTVETIYDQSPKGNHLRANHPGRHYPVDKGVNASAHPIAVNGQRVYGAWFDEGMGYRNDNTRCCGMAVGEQPESMYAVLGGHHYNDMCCFDYGNAESHIGADGPGTMEAIYFGNCTSWWSKEAKAGIPKDWNGPLIMADIEAGMYAGNDTFNPLGTPIEFDFATLMLKGQVCEMALKAGNAQEGKLAVKYDGGRPTHADYNPMRKQGGLILGTGGDNSDRALGIFYEGAIAMGYATAATDDAIQANVVAAGYGK